MREAHYIFARRAFLFGFFLVAMAGLTRPAIAIEKYGGIPLPDNLLGSTARSLTKVGPGTLAVVGAENTFQGPTDAVYWRVIVGPAGEEISTDKYVLPKPQGMSAVATGIAFENGDPERPTICGFIGTDVSGTRAVIWRRDASGQFTNTILDDEAVANGLVAQNTYQGATIVVCGRFMLPDGSWHAALWKITDAGIEREDLGTLGGMNSEAMALSYVDDLIGWNIVGSADRPNGRTLATAWIVRLTSSGDLDWFRRALPTPPGAESNAVYVGGANGGIWKTSGYVMDSNGRRSASVWINQGEIPSAFVSALYQDVLGRRFDTIANGIVGDFNRDQDLDAADFVVGTARNSLGLQRGIGALPLNQPFDAPFPFDLLQKDVGLNWTSIALNAADPSGAIAGQGLVEGSSTPQAMLFVPTNDEVPQIIAILIGLAVGRRDINDIYLMWQPDGNGATLRPRREGKISGIMAEWTSTRASNSARAPEKLTIVSRIMPRNMNPSSDLILTLQIHDGASNTWVNVASRVLSFIDIRDGAYFRLEIDIPVQIVVPAGQPLRWRTSLRGEEWRDWQIDLMEMKTTPVAP